MPAQFTTPVTMPSTTNYTYTYYYGTNKKQHFLLIPLIPVQQQIKTTFSTANANAPTTAAKS